MSFERNRAVALFDGMNLYNHALRAFGDLDGRYDPVRLARSVAESQGCELVQTRFYVGVPSRNKHRRLFNYWNARLRAMRANGVIVFQGTVNDSGQKGQEKGVDIRIALDSVDLVLDGLCDTLIIFSTDQDFQQIKPTALKVANQFGRRLRIKSAFPSTQKYSIRGVDGTDWVPFDRKTYFANLDPRDFWST